MRVKQLLLLIISLVERVLKAINQKRPTSDNHRFLGEDKDARYNPRNAIVSVCFPNGMFEYPTDVVIIIQLLEEYGGLTRKELLQKWIFLSKKSARTLDYRLSRLKIDNIITSIPNLNDFRSPAYILTNTLQIKDCASQATSTKIQKHPKKRQNERKPFKELSLIFVGSALSVLLGMPINFPLKLVLIGSIFLISLIIFLFLSFFTYE